MTTHNPPTLRVRPTLWDGLVALLVLLAAGFIFFLLRPTPSNFLTASIVLDGETIAQYDLNALDGPLTLELERSSYPLTIEAEPGRIHIAHSQCPGSDCVRTGWADRPGSQIICLPNKLIISLSGEGNAREPSIDGATH